MDAVRAMVAAQVFWEGKYPSYECAGNFGVPAVTSDPEKLKELQTIELKHGRCTHALPIARHRRRKKPDYHPPSTSAGRAGAAAPPARSGAPSAGSSACSPAMPIDLRWQWQ
jgi:hypothetical protein